MANPKLAAITAAAALGLALPACSLDVPDLNNPGLDELENHPTAVSIASAATGLLIGSRGERAQENGYIAELGIIGREAYCFDGADPRFISELVEGQLNAASPFGGNFWAIPYANIRLGHLILDALDKVPTSDLDGPARSAIRGFVHTIQALDLLQVIDTHDTIGAVIDTDQPIVRPPGIQPLGAIADKPAVLARIEQLLDGAVGELTAGGDSFPFLLSTGYVGFDTPATFLTFNRALRARVAVYAGQYADALIALQASFLDENEGGSFDNGVYDTFSTKSGDTANGLINPNLYAHPSLLTDAAPGDARYARKVKLAKTPGAVPGHSSPLAFTIYRTPGSPLSVIRNEELVLLKAEALFFTGDPARAVTELNLVRVQSGKLAPLPSAPLPDTATFVEELLYERRYSLLFEGHRWIDLRRFNRLDPAHAPLDKPTDTLNVRYPLPLPECNARPGEAKCSQGSV